MKVKVFSPRVLLPPLQPYVYFSNLTFFMVNKLLSYQVPREIVDYLCPSNSYLETQVTTLAFPFSTGLEKGPHLFCDQMHSPGFSAGNLAIDEK